MKSIEKFYDVPMGFYSGILLREKQAKKLAKLLYKQNQEVKELLASDLSQVEVSEWTLAYPNGEQTVVKFYNENETPEKKLDRINLIDKEKMIRYCDSGVFIAEDMEDAEQRYMKWFDNTVFSSELNE